VHQFLNASSGGAKSASSSLTVWHERYFEELDAVAALRKRFETEQVTPLTITP
jgi:hypothetical protein